MGNSSYINVIAFVVITILYYFLKPTLTLKRDEAQKYKETRYVYLSVYLMVIILTQFFVNISIIKSTCGGNIKDNIGPAALFTFMPWLFIFGVMVVVLILYPGFKSVFSDVIGYFYISSAANEIITTLLINKEVEDAMESKGGEPSASSYPEPPYEQPQGPPPQYPPPQGPPPQGPPPQYPPPTYEQSFFPDPSAPPQGPPPQYPPPTYEQSFFPDPSAPPQGPPPTYEQSFFPDPSAPPQGPQPPYSEYPKGGGIKRKPQIQKGGGKKEMQDAAEIIVKICGNMSVLINQITPENFEGYWKILIPLMKPKYQDENNTVETNKLKDDLFQLVVTRDNIGESVWYIYAGILVTSVVQLKITNRGCVKNVEQIEKDYQTFLDEEAVAQANKKKLEEKTYTL